jgi:cytochrome c-type biogenesis protein CcmI
VSGADLLPSIIGIVLVAAAAAFVLLPFARGAQLEVAPQETSEADIPDRLAIYHQVLELEFDRQLGKLSAEDFQQLSAELLAQAGQALREERGTLGEIDEEIEREIAAARVAFAAARGTKPAARGKRVAQTR